MPNAYGEYAQVIREDDGPVPSPAPREGAGGSPHDRRTRGDGQLAQTRAITVGPPAGSQPQASPVSATTAPTDAPSGNPGHVPAANPDDDDPGYGPPGPDWYRRDAEEKDAPAVRPAREATDADAARSPFEPIRRSGQEPGPAAPNAGDRPWAAQPESPDDAPTDYQNPDDFELDLSGLEGDTLGQLHGLYSIAGQIPGGGSDEQFHQLLERQRKLISEYFKESGSGQGPAVPPPGRDAGDNLAGIRGERLRRL